MRVAGRVAVCSGTFSRDPILREELLARYPHVTFNETGDRLNGRRLLEFLDGHDRAIVALERVDEWLLARLPDLAVISKYGVGLDTIDVEAVSRYGKRLAWTPGVNRRSVSELVIAFAIALLREVPAAQRELLAGTWRPHVGGCLSGRTVGIVGCGCIGQDLVPLLKAFGCRLLLNDIQDRTAVCVAYGVEAVSLERLLAEADVVTLHVPLDASTRNLLNRERLSLMKPSAVLINTARGGLVDEDALCERLRDGRLAAAGFDVFLHEPDPDRRLIELPNFLATPHIGGSAREAILAMGRAAIAGLDGAVVSPVAYGI